ncbi:hypothetical protein Tco_0592714 [Tanacetum coccineum]
MPFSRFTKVIINHFLKQHKSLSNLKYQHYHTIKDDGIVSLLKFVRIGEDYHEYGLVIPEAMLNEAIKQLESYQMFIKYSTGQIPPKKSRGKGSQRKKTTDDSQETIDVSEEYEPERVKRKTSSKRRVKKKVTLSTDDNIISDDPDTALELGKSLSKTEAEEAEAARQVHADYKKQGNTYETLLYQCPPKLSYTLHITEIEMLALHPLTTPQQHSAHGPRSVALVVYPHLNLRFKYWRAYFGVRLYPKEASVPSSAAKRGRHSHHHHPSYLSIVELLPFILLSHPTLPVFNHQNYSS